jgi:hypothetical protein
VLTSAVSVEPVAVGVVDVEFDTRDGLSCLPLQRRDAHHFLSYWANAEKRGTTAVLNNRVDAHLAAYPELIAITATLLVHSERAAERGRVAPTELLRRINGQTERTHTDATPIEQWLHHQR